MSEKKTVEKISRPNTKSSLVEDFRRLGLKAGMTLLVHSSLSQLGWVCGGPVAVIEALLEVLTETGTLVMPTHSSGNSDPARWMNPPIPESWWPIVREEMPAFDPAKTPSEHMGAIPEAFRTFPGVKRSDHPANSFAAWGKNAQLILARHGLEFSLGEASPLARLYDIEAHVLLLGVDHGSNTSFHLAEARLSKMPTQEASGAVLNAGKRRWVRYQDFVYDSDDFPAAGAAFEKTGGASIGSIAAAPSRLFPQKEAVDFALGYLEQHRKCATSSSP